jgi:hypothetical protein
MSGYHGNRKLLISYGWHINMLKISSEVIKMYKLEKYILDQYPETKG